MRRKRRCKTTHLRSLILLLIFCVPKGESGTRSPAALDYHRTVASEGGIGDLVSHSSAPARSFVAWVVGYPIDPAIFAGNLIRYDQLISGS